MYFACWHVTDTTIQKLKQQYNQSGGPALQVTLAEVQDDLKLRPPQILTTEEVELTNGIANGHVEQVPGCGKTYTVQHTAQLNHIDYK